jgi:hypothetical protein
MIVPLPHVPPYWSSCTCRCHEAPVTDGWDVLNFISVSCFTVWLLLTLCLWMFPLNSQEAPTLVEVVKAQGAWLWVLLHRVW